MTLANNFFPSNSFVRTLRKLKYDYGIHSNHQNCFPIVGSFGGNVTYIIAQTESGGIQDPPFHK
jgi:hypothetical protein